MDRSQPRQLVKPRVRPLRRRLYYDPRPAATRTDDWTDGADIQRGGPWVLAVLQPHPGCPRGRAQGPAKRRPGHGHSMERPPMGVRPLGFAEEAHGVVPEQLAQLL